MVLLTLIFVIFSIRTSWFQSWLAHQVSNYYSKKFGTEVRVDKVDIVFVDQLDIENVYVEDIKRDTFLFAGAIHVDISGWSLSESFVDVSNTTLENGHIHIRKYKGDSTWNFQHIIDFFVSEEVDTTSSDFDVTVQEITLNKIHFIYEDQNRQTSDKGIDFSHIDLNHLSGGFSNFSLSGGQIGVSLDKLEFAEKSGLKLNRLRADLTYGAEFIYLKDLRLGLNRTLIRADYLAFETPNGGEDWQEFLNRVRIKSHLQNTIIHIPDLAHLVPSIWGIDGDIIINNVITSGPIFGMKLKEMDIALLDTTRIKGNFQIPDMAELPSSFFQEDISLFRTSIADVRKLNLERILDEQEASALDRALRQYGSVGTIELKKGSFIGGLGSFVVDGELTSGIGNIDLEYGLQFVYNDRDGIYYYGGPQNDTYGKITVSNLNMGVIAGNDALDCVSGSIYVEGKGFDEKNLDVHFNGNLSSVSIFDYNYSGITVKKGEFANNLFTGVIDIKDDNLALNYDGQVDLKDRMHFDFDVRIDSAQVAELSGADQEIYQCLKSKIKVNVYGTGINELYGDIVVKDFDFKDENMDLSMDQLSLHVARHPDSDTIRIRSSLADLDLTGKYDLKDIGHALTEQFSYVISNLIDDQHVHDADHEYYHLTILVKEVNVLLAHINGDMQIANNTLIRSEFNHEEKLFALDVNSDYFEISGMRFEDLKIENHYDSLNARMHFSVEHAQITDSMAVRNLYFDSQAKDNKFVTTTGWDGLGEMKPALFAFETDITQEKDLLTVFRPSFFFLKDHRYDVNRNSSFLWNPEEIIFKDFKVLNKEHYLGLEGVVSHDPEDWLKIIVHDFDLSDLNGLLGESLEIQGLLNIQGRLSDVYNKTVFDAQSSINKLYLNRHLVGDLTLGSHWNTESKSIAIKGDLKRDSLETFTFDGNYFVERESDNLDFKANFDGTDIGFLKAFEDPDLYTEIEGSLDGGLTIRGELDKPIVTGKMNIVRSNVKIPMFNVSFGASGLLKFNDGEIIADHLLVIDQEQNKADAQMQIYHYDWVDWNYNILLDMDHPMLSDEFLLMDTKYKEGDHYYGKAYVSGMVDIFGYDDHSEIEVDLTTEKGTTLTLPMYGSTELEEGSFIVFDEDFFFPDRRKDQADSQDANKIERLGMTLTMKFNVTPETEVRIIFDQVYEDQIISKGEGNLEIKVDDFGDMTMFGEYVIRDGRYEMRIKQLVEEDFLLDNGSMLQWTGSPYDADIKINAKFLREVSLRDIIPPEAAENRRKKDQVYGILRMTNTLMSPNLVFDIEAPNTDDLGKKAINEINADNDERNRQFFALLVLKRFLPRFGGTAGGGDALLGLAEIQINSILSGISENYEFKAGISEGETTIGVETKLNDRTTVTTSFGVLSTDDASNVGNIVGDVNIEYRLNDDGTFTMNFFNETNSSSVISQGAYTQGIGLHYQEIFNTTKEFRAWQKFLNVFRSKANKTKFEKRSRRNEKWVPVPNDFHSTTAN